MRSFRVVLHAHSTWSYDGSWELEAVARLYGRLGIDAVMMTEHDTGFDPANFPDYRAACANASTAKCRLIPGVEYSSPENDVHVLTWGLHDYLAEHQPVAATLSAVAEAGGVAILAHPARREAWRAYRDEWRDRLSGIELWNRKTDGVTVGPEALELINRSGLPATVGQDFHTARHLYPLTMRADLDRLDEDGLVAALKEGKMLPFAFGRPLLQSDGTPATGFHDRLETTRRRARDIRNRLLART